ncbi:hypothetical protein [Azospira sp. I09]|jgi:hypothetical protein|uniref:hypothetical protein n=1 Tax=Azospira sp. I09 TaxID=1765049 RepID=UPI001260B821|nr:hypothetical protein [Azospira sp. I09]BBN88476.1 hypothetical protein AZSP09_14990 [Azospira sp. I09]
MSRLKSAVQAVKENVFLVVLFLFLIASALIVQECCGAYGASLGPNLLSEFIGAAITVYGIDFLIRRREEKRLLPVRAASYEDVRIMAHWALNLWKAAYEKSVGNADPTSWRQLLSDEFVQRVMISLDIARPANILPPAPWGNYVDHEMQRIHQWAEKILERHSSALDPEIHRAVYSIIYYKHHSIANLQQHDRRDRIPRPTNLGSYMPVIREWFDAVIELHEWTIKMHEYLVGKGITRIHAPYHFVTLAVTDAPDARLCPEDLTQQAQLFQSWQQRQANARPAA